MTTPMPMPVPLSFDEHIVAAKAHAAAMQADHTQARGKGFSPLHLEARRRVAKTFCEIHLPGDSPAERESRLNAIDYMFPVHSTNIQGKDVDKKKMFSPHKLLPKKLVPKPLRMALKGMDRKKAYLVSTAYPPKGPEDPIYALEYVPHSGKHH